MRPLMAVIVVGLLVAAPTVADDQVLSTIERNLAEQYSSIRNIEVKFRVLPSVPADGPMPQKSLDEATSWEWLQSDSKKLVRQHPHRHSNGQISLTWYSFDGRKAYEMWCWQTDGSRPDTIRIRDSIDPSYYSSASPIWMLGLQWSGCDTNVLDWLKRRTPATVRDLGVERIADRDCRKVEFDNVPVRGKFGTRAIVWFDPEADWLPRRLNMFPLRHFEMARRQLEARPGDVTPLPPMSLSFEPGETIGHHEVLNYLRVEDALLGRPRWFPKQAQGGRVRKQGTPGEITTIFEVDSVVLNQPIDAARFIPLPAPGTQTEDFTAEGGPRFTIFGGNEGLAIRREMNEAQSMEGPRPKPAVNTQQGVATQATKPGVISTPDARPLKRSWWWSVAAATGVLVALVSFRKWSASRS